MDERSRFLEQAERCRRVAEKINEPSTAGALQALADEYERKAEEIGAAPDGEQESDPNSSDAAHESALAILREFEQARANLIGKAVILSDGKAGTIDRIFLDELHGLRISIEGHEGQWPISTVKLSE
jgi:hypothetical protein